MSQTKKTKTHGQSGTLNSIERTECIKKLCNINFANLKNFIQNYYTITSHLLAIN